MGAMGQWEGQLEVGFRPSVGPLYRHRNRMGIKSLDGGPWSSKMNLRMIRRIATRIAWGQPSIFYQVLSAPVMRLALLQAVTTDLTLAGESRF